jgi:hypothetical protein
MADAEVKGGMVHMQELVRGCLHAHDPHMVMSGPDAVPKGTDHSAPAYSESERPWAFAIAVVNIRCGGVDLCGERSGVAAAFTIGSVFAIAGFAVAGEDCTSST